MDANLEYQNSIYALVTIKSNMRRESTIERAINYRHKAKQNEINERFSKRTRLKFSPKFKAITIP